ncbi:MAG: hypothetical protein CSA81_03080 [Acidobacteria bacterium]|nr:MAG: hypothetical protein CSA81_03080 [Acidobacteriota bacterium]
MRIEKQGKSTIFFEGTVTGERADASPAVRALLEYLPHTPSSLVICTQEPVWSKHGQQLLKELGSCDFPVHVQVYPDGEACKTLNHFGHALEEMVRLGCDRKSVILAFGGGTVGDSAGFVAATFMRGISWLYIPTTLLAMQDASVGGKVAVNLEQGKNLAGAFWQPEGISLNLRYLRTLSDRHFKSGTMELIKHGVLKGNPLYEEMLHFPLSYQQKNRSWHHVCFDGVRVKMDMVDRDYREAGLRKALNLGHTLAHALEKVTSFQLYHGEAVGLGLMYACCLAQELGHCFDWKPLEKFIMKRMPDHLVKSLFDSFPEMNNLLFYTSFDKKKTSGKVTWIIPERPGKVSFNDQIEESHHKRAFENWKKIIRI